MNDQGLRFAEEWFRLLAEAARGTRTAQSTIRSLANLTPDKLARRIAHWLPAGVSPPSAQAVARWTGDMWAALGMVPRSRYLELLERYEALRLRLEEAEVTIQRLKRLLSEHGHEGDAEKLLDLWSNAIGETLKSQADWMRTWIVSAPPVETEPKSRKPADSAKPRRRKSVKT